MDGVFRIFAQAGPTRLLAALGVTGIVAALLFSIMFKVDAGGKTLLFSGLEPSEASAIIARLDATGVKYELRGDGSSIFVEDKKALSTRMALAGEGLPSRGSIGYEIFDKQDALGANTFVQNINKLRALEGELSRTIMSLDGVTAARVHLVMPERRLFENEDAKASASIVVRARGGMLEAQGVRAIRNLVASAVPGLDVNRVTLVDEHGRLLAAGAEDASGLSGDVGERQNAVEERLRKAVADIVESVAGPGAARVQVSADLDMNRVTQASETFDPDGQVVRSTSTVDDSGSSADGAGASGGVSAANNVPGGNAGAQSGGGGAQTSNSRTEETVNYEISKTTKTEIFESGAVKRLSVAVAVDDLAKVDAAGKATYTPRTPAEMQRIEALVKSAVGYDEKRGDTVQVVNIAFSRPEADFGKDAKAPMMNLDKADMFRIGELATMALAALALIFFVLRPLVGGLLGGGGGGQGAAAGRLSGPGVAVAMGQEGAQAGLPSPGQTQNDRTSAAINAALEGMGPNKIDETIGVAKIQGEIKASSVRRVAEVIDSHPDESISIMRTWMHESS